MATRSDREEQHLKGPVKTVHTYWAPLSLVDGRESCPEDDQPDFQHFDSDGRFLEETSSERALLQEAYRYVYQYDDSQNLIVREEFDSDGNHSGTTTTSQNGGTAVESSRYSNGELNRVRHFDLDGRITEIIHYGLHNEVAGRYTYEYIRSENTLEERSYEFGPMVVDGRLRYVKMRRLDQNGRLVEETTTRADGSLWEKRSVEVEKDLETLRRIHDDESGKIKQSDTTCSDADGILIEEACYHGDGSLNSRHEITYEFDSRGNWIKRTIYRWVSRWSKVFYEPVSLTRRTITYY